MANVEFKSNVKQILSEEEKVIKVALNLVGQFVEDESKLNLTKNGSVNTGNLRNSMTHDVRINEKAVYIGTNVEYAPYVELGTYKQKAKPYLKPAITDNSKKINDFIEKAMGK